MLRVDQVCLHASIKAGKKNGSLHNDFNALQKVHVSDFSKIIKILIFQHLGCPNRAITISLVINRVEIQNSETVFCRQAIWEHFNKF